MKPTGRSFTVSPPDGGPPGCIDSAILNVACFSALPSGLFAAMVAFWCLPEWVGRDYGFAVVLVVGVPAIVGFGLLYHRLLHASRAWILSRPPRLKSIPRPVSPTPRISGPDLGILSIRRGDSLAALRVEHAGFMIIRSPEGNMTAFYFSAPEEVGDPAPVDEDGFSHPGAWMQVFLPILAETPEPLAIACDLEDPRCHVPWRREGPMSSLFDYEMSTVVRFKFRFQIEPGQTGPPTLIAEGRTAGGPGGDPPPIRFAISCLCSYWGEKERGDRPWGHVLRDHLRA